jgi:hypothetical protein
MTSTYNFFSCYQKSGQSFTEWKAELYDKVRRCGFTTSVLANKPIERAIRDMYVIGVKNPKILQALLKEGDPDLEAAEKLILAAERLAQDVRYFGHPLKDNDSSVDKIHDKQFKSNKQKQPFLNKNHNPDKDRTYSPCETCGSTKHLRSQCKFRDYTCNYCKKNGHLEKVCRRKKTEQRSTKHITTVAKLNSSNSHTSTIQSFDSSCMLSLEVNENPIAFEIDTGSSHTIISMSDWRRLGSPVLSPSKLRLKCYSGNGIGLVGEGLVPVQYNNHISHLKLIVVQDAHPPLLGLQWIRSLKLDLNKLIRIDQTDIHHVVTTSKLQLILQKYNHVLNSKLGHCTKVKAHIELQPNTSPKFFKPRPILFAYLDQVKEEITRKVAAGILERVDTSLWAAPIVPVKKPNGKIRICGDFKVTINPYTLVDQHPIPSVDQLFSRLRNGQQFTKLDLSDAYLQVELDDSSKSLVVINTPLGL